MPLRLIVVGKTGHGKSSTCNTLVGGQRFEADFCASAVTTSCQAEKNDAMGLTIVDTPGLCDSEASLRERALEIQRSVLEVCKKPHAFLLVFKLGRISNDDQMTIDLLGIIFGKKVFDHSIVVLTHGCDNCRRNGSTDELSKGSDEYDERNDNQDEDNELASFCSKSRVLEPLRLCNGRVIRIENNVEKKCSIHTTKKLFSKLIRCVKSVSNNGKTVFTNTYLDTHHQTLENYIEQYDTLQKEIVHLRQILMENLEKAKDEERESKEIKMKVIAALASSTIGGAALGSIAGIAGAGLLVKSAAVGAVIGGPAGAIVGLGIGAAVVGTVYSSKQKKN